jgi:tetratricopeptide (TPR) repeat protein
MNQEFTFTQHFLTEGRVILYYVTLLVFPHPSRLTFDYAFSVSYGWLDPPSTLVALLVIFGVIAWAFSRCRRSPLVAFGVLWFFLNLAIESSLIPLDLAYEHRLYLPSMGPALLAALAGWWAWRGWTAGGFKYLPLVACSILILVWTAWTIERNRVWATEFSLWTDTVAKAPANPRALVTLALAHMERGELDRAMDLAQAAVRANPSYYLAYTTLAYLHLARNNRAAAIENFQAALRLVPGDPDGHYQVARLLDDAGRLPEAEAHYRRFLDVATSDQATARAWTEARIRVIGTHELAR